MKNKNKIIVLLIIIVFLISFFVMFYIRHNSINNNIISNLNSDADFLNWFIDFDELYKKEVGTPYYSLSKEPFELIKKTLSNEKVNNIVYEENKYKIDNITLELDANTRSFRYIKYKNKNAIEILEVKLKNGIYYVQLAKHNHLYRIAFNKKYFNKDKYKIKTIHIKNSIFATENLDWEEYEK